MSGYLLVFAHHKSAYKRWYENERTVGVGADYVHNLCDLRDKSSISASLYFLPDWHKHGMWKAYRGKALAEFILEAIEFKGVQVTELGWECTYGQHWHTRLRLIAKQPYVTEELHTKPPRFAKFDTRT